MGFIRIKQISGKSYAYLVENKWYKRGFAGRGKGSRQSVSKYLGRVYEAQRRDDQDFFSFNKVEDVSRYVVQTPQEQIIKDLVVWELQRHTVPEDVKIDFRGKKVKKGTKEITLKLNEGFLNSYTLRRLFNLRKDDSYYLAKCFVEAGIQIPQELFAELFSEE